LRAYRSTLLAGRSESFDQSSDLAADVYCQEAVLM
jgi:hypothetical protein